LALIARPGTFPVAIFIASHGPILPFVGSRCDPALACQRLPSSAAPASPAASVAIRRVVVRILGSFLGAPINGAAWRSLLTGSPCRLPASCRRVASLAGALAKSRGGVDRTRAGSHPQCGKERYI